MWLYAFAFTFCWVPALLLVNEPEVVYMCDDSMPDVKNSEIYCMGGAGSILSVVLDKHNLYQADSKNFVDSPLRNRPEVVLENFQMVNKSDKEAVKQFLADNFFAPGDELVNCTFSDFHPQPSRLNKIKDPTYRQWAVQVHALWNILCRQMNETIHDHPEFYSIIYVPYPYVAPGGRFREFYYWDNYWIVKGLLVSDMYTTAKHVILNLAYMVARFGFVPNGGRIYYLQRSQPPMFIPMIYDYVMITGDRAILDIKIRDRTVLSLMRSEFDFWIKNRVAETPFDEFLLFHYTTPSNTGRPESYDKDVHIIRKVSGKARRHQLLKDIAAACESGWDFSSRWLADRTNLQTMKTTRILPVDLNAFMCGNSYMLADLYAKLGRTEEANEMRLLHTDFKRAIDAVFWNETIGTWLDYDLDTESHNPIFYPSSVVPLFARCFESVNATRANLTFNFFMTHGVLDYKYGIPTSTLDTGEQWDFPNAWSPVIHMIVEGFRSANDPFLNKQALIIAQEWVELNYFIFQNSSFMLEKYDVVNGRAGYGGEYGEAQIGFGWTNGVILDLLNTYTDDLRHIVP